MSKSDDDRYLDKNKTMLYTANNLYKSALEGFSNTNILKEQKGVITPLVLSGYLTARSELIEVLLFGKTEACAGLAYLNREGLGGTKSPYNEKLFLTIGGKLGDQKCTAALTKLQHNNYDVEKEANIWVSHINNFKKDLNTEITSRELADNIVFLKNALTKNNIGLDTCNSHFNCAKSEEEIAETFVPQSMTGQDNYYNKAPTTTTSYPHATPKYATTAAGETNEKHHHCEIL